ncbi:hypothetical protein MANAM107_05750 [Actinomyces capricornis]|uniref:Uncharacterized protein n=1 Tax=Actinomyces capricornis TaxID=2755559 RepID=A0ABN6K443_9ACTO|nr:hypothetical protein MANAM107_05750 [Actinomyces capricornis]
MVVATKNSHGHVYSVGTCVLPAPVQGGGAWVNAGTVVAPVLPDPTMTTAVPRCDLSPRAQMKE